MYDELRQLPRVVLVEEEEPDRGQRCGERVDVAAVQLLTDDLAVCCAITEPLRTVEREQTLVTALRGSVPIPCTGRAPVSPV